MQALFCSAASAMGVDSRATGELQAATTPSLGRWERSHPAASWRGAVFPGPALDRVPERTQIDNVLRHQILCLSHCGNPVWWLATALAAASGERQRPCPLPVKRTVQASPALVSQTTPAGVGYSNAMGALRMTRVDCADKLERRPGRGTAVQEKVRRTRNRCASRSLVTILSRMWSRGGDDSRSWRAGRLGGMATGNPSTADGDGAGPSGKQLGK
jgi:hypothetical protein